MLYSVVTGVLTLTCCGLYHAVATRRLRSDLDRARAAERRGRIRAEVRLRTALKERRCADDKNTGRKDDLALRRIGTVTSPFTKRMGTPRQGSLVPDARAYVEFDTAVCPMECVDGMDAYSHCWVLFGFHANTDLPANRGGRPTNTKVRPPRSTDGKKVGMLATRSPHRPNALGLSLVTVDRVDHTQRRLYVQAVDLVHGTPVYDVKPYVPWDIPNYDRERNNTVLRVPDWVDRDDELRHVSFTDDATTALQDLWREGRLAPLYGGGDDDDDLAAAVRTLRQVLAQDPRAANRRGTGGTTNNRTGDPVYRIVFCTVQFSFVVSTTMEVKVVGVTPVDFHEATFVDGIPLMDLTLAGDDVGTDDSNPGDKTS